MTTTIIYVLLDPRTDEVRYVGKTCQSTVTRLAAHVRRVRSTRPRTHKECWIAGLLSEGVRPAIREIERCDGDWVSRERFWIAHFRSTLGDRLCNQTDGGDGHTSEVAAALWTDERRVKQSAITAAMNRSRKGEKWNEDRRVQQSLAQKKRWDRADSKVQHRQKMKEICARPDYRAQQSISVAKSWTDERRARQSEVAKRVNANPVKRASQAALMASINKSRAGQKWSAKRRAACKKAKDNAQFFGSAGVQHAARDLSAKG